MPTHDCSKCKVVEICSLVGIAPWLNDHEDKVVKAVGDRVELLVKVCDALIAYFPPAMLCSEQIAMLAKESFILGYHTGRAFPTIPAVFQIEG